MKKINIGNGNTQIEIIQKSHDCVAISRTVWNPYEQSNTHHMLLIDSSDLVAICSALVNAKNSEGV